MLIPVIYKDKRHDLVKNTRIDEFLNADKIAMFHRKNGWVRVGVDPVRTKKNEPYLRGANRRKG